MTEPASLIPAWKKKLPMLLTWSRIAVCPFLMLLLAFDSTSSAWISSLLFILASLTDWFDGYLARKYDAISNLGKFMDPIADKILVTTVLVMLISLARVGPVLVILLLARDILIGGIRAVAAADQVVIDAKAAGKWITALQMIGIPSLLLPPGELGPLPLVTIGNGLLWASVLLSLISGFQYIELYRRGRSQSANAAEKDEVGKGVLND